MFADFLRLLDSFEEGDGTLLDNTAVVWMWEQSNGGTHNRRDMPIVIAGSMCGTLETGRRIDAGGTPHNGFLVSLARAMDVPTEQFGDQAYSNGPLVDLFA